MAGFPAMQNAQEAWTAASAATPLKFQKRLLKRNKRFWNFSPCALFQKLLGERSAWGPGNSGYFNLNTRYFLTAGAWMVVTAVTTVALNIVVTVVTAVTAVGAAMAIAQSG